MDHVLALKCTICGAEYGVDEAEYICPHHGDDGILDVIYDYDLIAQRISPDQLADQTTASIWRYLPLIPVDDPGHPGTPLRAVGWTPLFTPTRLAHRLDLHHLW